MSYKGIRYESKPDNLSQQVRRFKNSLYPPTPCSYLPEQFIRIIELRWACSSAGRAPALQAGGRGFESRHVHQPFLFQRNSVGLRVEEHLVQK
jgi:hypothetical protein